MFSAGVSEEDTRQMYKNKIKINTKQINAPVRMLPMRRQLYIFNRHLNNFIKKPWFITDHLKMKS